MVPVKLEICFDNGQFAGDTKNLQDQRAVVILRAKMFVDITNLAHEFLKNFENAANCSKIYAIS